LEKCGFYEWKTPDTDPTVFNPFRRQVMEHTTNTPAKKLPLYRSLYVQVITAVIIGVLLGYFYPPWARA
jgi:hypothetical protein